MSSFGSFLAGIFFLLMGLAAFYGASKDRFVFTMSKNKPDVEVSRLALLLAGIFNVVIACGCMISAVTTAFQ
jgi:hypothetical protein